MASFRSNSESDAALLRPLASRQSGGNNGLGTKDAPFITATLTSERHGAMGQTAQQRAGPAMYHVNFHTYRNRPVFESAEYLSLAETGFRRCADALGDTLCRLDHYAHACTLDGRHISRSAAWQDSEPH